MERNVVERHDERRGGRRHSEDGRARPSTAGASARKLALVSTSRALY
ncbi:hypothetical protein SCE1572_14745 [Sorangium cellulosum So0157-2]|uniref:Uncharacterized protein n=1 Tax=Sorangium cellulosum So0157-2 TaxID=1254432 RepID=S4XUT5_SORCE|nr:hypothetical protein SCE1572_14745 [Sorangium cellulosum So0157-2]